MRKLAFVILAAVSVAVLVAVAATRGAGPGAAKASSHREAPLISQDPTADNTDLYAFVSPDKPDTATIIANWIPGEDPAAGPNYYTFSTSARYDIYVDKNGDGKPDTTYYFRFTNLPSQFFLGNTQQRYTVTKVVGGKSTLGRYGPADPAGQHRPALDAELPQPRDAQGIHSLADGSTVFAGQRDDAFFADVGAIFDLVAIRYGTGATGGGKDFLSGYGVHSIALQIPKSQLDNSGNHTIGVWAATDRQKVDRAERQGGRTQWVQVSRLGNPLINEVVIPTNLKDQWNATSPADDKQFEKYYANPILATVLQKLYPQFGPFQDTDRSDLVAVLRHRPEDAGAELHRADVRRRAPAQPVDPADAVRQDQPARRARRRPGRLSERPPARGRRRSTSPSGRSVASLIGHSLPLGDGVDANDVPNQHVFPYEADPFSGFDNTKSPTPPEDPGSARRLAHRRDGGGCGRRRPRLSAASSTASRRRPREPTRCRRRSCRAARARASPPATRRRRSPGCRRELRADPQQRQGARHARSRLPAARPRDRGRDLLRARRRAPAARARARAARSGRDRRARPARALAPPLPRGARARPARQRISPTTAGVYGVIGDAELELGRYAQAFRAFDRMASIKPSVVLVLPRLVRPRAARPTSAGRAGDAARASAAVGEREASPWTHVQLGLLYLATRPVGARTARDARGAAALSRLRLRARRDGAGPGRRSATFARRSRYERAPSTRFRCRSTSACSATSTAPAGTMPRRSSSTR